MKDDHHMQSGFQELLRDLEAFGTSNDKTTASRQEKMLNITPDTGAFLSVLIQATKSKSILEIGTSNGYSTLWLAAAAEKNDGLITTVEIQDHKIEKACRNFVKSGLQHRIKLVQADATRVLRSSADHQYDFIFLDSARDQYSDWWPQLVRTLVPGGLLVIDNALSHREDVA